jgi:hypothetical protein
VLVTVSRRDELFKSWNNERTAKEFVEKGAELYIRVYRFNPMPRATAGNTGRLAVSALALRHKI